MRDEGVDFGDGPLGVTASLGAGLDGSFRRGLRAVPAVNRQAQREPEVALGDGLFRSAQRIDGRRQLGGGKLFRSGGARGIDGALGLVHLFTRRLSARD